MPTNVVVNMVKSRELIPRKIRYQKRSGLTTCGRTAWKWDLLLEADRLAVHYTDAVGHLL